MISKIAPPASCLCLPLRLAQPSLSPPACSCLSISYGRVIRKPLPHSNRGVFVSLFLSGKKSLFLFPLNQKNPPKKPSIEICCTAPFYIENICKFKAEKRGGGRTYEIQEQICIFYFTGGWYKWKCKRRANLWLSPQFSRAFQFPPVSFWYETALLVKTDSVLSAWTISLLNNRVSLASLLWKITCHTESYLFFFLTSFSELVFFFFFNWVK